MKRYINFLFWKQKWVCGVFFALVPFLWLLPVRKEIEAVEIIGWVLLLLFHYQDGGFNVRPFNPFLKKNKLLNIDGQLCYLRWLRYRATEMQKIAAKKMVPHNLKVLYFYNEILNASKAEKYVMISWYVFSSAEDLLYMNEKDFNTYCNVLCKTDIVILSDFIVYCNQTDIPCRSISFGAYKNLLIKNDRK